MPARKKKPHRLAIGEDLTIYQAAAQKQQFSDALAAAPEQLDIDLSGVAEIDTAGFQLLMLVMVGGVGSIHGAIFGAIFLVLLPTVIAIVRDYLPAAIGQQPALEPGIYGLILVLVVLLEPLGLNGLWLKIKFFFSQFPMYKSATFKRQKTYMRTERLQ